MIHLAIVDDHAIVRRGLRQFLSEEPDLSVVAEAAHGREALDMVRQDMVDVVLLDLAMPRHSGVGALAEIKAQRPTLPVLILSGFPEKYDAIAMLRLGASGYLNKDCKPQELVKAIRTVARGHKYVSAAVGELLAYQIASGDDKAEHEHLSARELQVFLHLARGETIGRLADRMSLSVKTVSTYRSRMMEKMRLSSNSDLTYYALKNGLIQ
jgi:two-component system invasion response regulator UvrY